ncbi:restriction endonuclease subunit S [Neolewinella antarctica]|uniref:Type I restriction enzyme S subunit n=1 Tax=Neolewinella antarctica TaxID=442734 RepID=A0ABX0X8X7_9BACT|nr:restriction endonuclease subunit S [Neolewinella antarctica]NJC25676.1 type I restriction enzyme S subunit [Neolewinella antarctica]
MKFKEIVLQDGLNKVIDYRGKTPKLSKAGIKLISAANVKRGKLDFSTLKCISTDTFEKWATRGFTRPGDVLITTEAPVGEIALYPDDGQTYQLSRRVIALRADPTVFDNEYLYYYLQSRRPQYALSARSNRGSTVPRVLKPDILELPILAPSLKIQKRISIVLGSIDRKIDLLKQQNKTLESLAQTLFKSWFVDFDPVIDRMLLAGKELPEGLRKRGELRRSVVFSEGYARLPEAVLGLFPVGVGFSEGLGRWVPAGWAVGPVSKFADVIGGGTPSRKVDEYFTNNGIPWLSPKDLSGYNYKYIDKGAQDITKLGLSKSSAKICPIGTILFSSRAPIGYVAVVLNELTTNQGFKSLSPKSYEMTDYLYYYMKRITPEIDAAATGSTFKEISGGALKQIMILMPSLSVLSQFGDSLEGINNKQELLREQIQTLTKTRDTLLPKLISGELVV